MRPDLDAFERSYGDGSDVHVLIARIRELEAALEPFAQRWELRLDLGVPAWSEDDYAAYRLVRARPFLRGDS